jgi:hypothetical protein
MEKFPMNWLEDQGTRDKKKYIKTLFICWKIVLFWKVNYFPMFGSVIKNKLENILQCFVMSWKITY